MNKNYILLPQTARAWPITSLFCCGFCRRSQTTSPKILTKCLVLGQARKSYLEPNLKESSHEREDSFKFDAIHLGLKLFFAFRLLYLG